MKQLLIFVLLVVVSTAFAATAFGQCRDLNTEGPPYGNPITEDFNTLSYNQSDNVLPNGWLFSEAGKSANGKYQPGNGSDSTGDTYSFGATNSMNRTLGGLRDSTLVPTFGACFKNNTNEAFRYFHLYYTGKKWRAGQTAGGDKLGFEYSKNATSLTNGTWTALTALDYTSPSSPAVGAVDGDSVNTVRDSQFPRQYIPSNGTLFIRWSDFDITGADDGLGIDDFYLAPYHTLGGYVDVGGRVTTSNGQGISLATLTLIDGDGISHQTTTGSLGYYNFSGIVDVGSTVVISVSARRYTFSTPAIVRSVLDPITDANFVADPN
jgi:hypothetical protein